MAKMEEVTDVGEIADKMGWTSVEAPGGGEVEVEPVETKPEAGQPATEPPKAVETVEEEPELTDAEKLAQAEEKRRSFQSEADREKEAREAAETQVQQQIAVNRALMAQVQSMANVVKPFSEKYVQKETGPPKMDITNDDGFLDQQKLQTYLEERDTYKLGQIKNSVLQEVRQEQDASVAEKQLAEVADAYPEYVNLLTGQVDVERLKREVLTYNSSKKLVDVVAEMKGKPASPQTDKSIEAIERNAKKVTSVVESQETEPTPTKIPKEISEIQDFMGDQRLDFPDDFGGIE